MSSMLIFLLGAINILSFTCQSFFSKLYSLSYTGPSTAATPVFASLYGLIVGFITLAVGAGFQFSAALPTWLIGLSNGLILFLFNLSNVSASRTGPYTLQSLMTYSGNVLITLLFSTVVWHDHLAWYQLMGIAVMLLSFVMINLQSSAFIIRKKSYFLWIALLFITNGAYGVLMDAQQRIMQQTQRNEMIIITFFSSAIISLIYLVLTQKNRSMQAFSMPKKAWLHLCAASIAAASGVYTMMVLLANLSSSILYTIQNGAVLALTILLGHFILKEKLTRRMVLGILLSIISLVLLAI
ncbi:MAG: EamA family transporter [Clostridia bacterium]|nr:EamA family transporter [Clostridia bacterium]